jgi:hypothetical protein
MDRGDAASLAAAVTPDLECWPLDSVAAEAMLVHRLTVPKPPSKRAQQKAEQSDG